LPNFALAAGFTDACAAKRRISGCCTTSTPCANRTTAVSVDKSRLARTIVIRFRPPEPNCDCSMLVADFGGDPGPWSGGAVPGAVITCGCGPNFCYSMTISALRPEFCDSHKYVVNSRSLSRRRGICTGPRLRPPLCASCGPNSAARRRQPSRPDGPSTLTAPRAPHKPATTACLTTTDALPATRGAPPTSPTDRARLR
jgi:hypothetical protein